MFCCASGGSSASTRVASSMSKRRARLTGWRPQIERVARTPRAASSRKTVSLQLNACDRSSAGSEPR